MRGALKLLAFASVVLGSPSFAGPASSHTGVVKTKRFEVRYRPGSRAAADADRQAVAAERDLDRIAAALETTPKGPFTLWIYDDVDELHLATGTEGCGGFSSNDGSHVPYDNDQTRLHELAHLVAHEWPKSGPESRNLFLVEGLANAVLEFVHGVHVHAVALHYKRTGRLPPIAEMTDATDFYAWMRAHPGLNAYDVAASWMRFLIDAHGLAKAKRYYTGTPAKTAFGADVPALEKAWHAMLDKFPIRSEVETLLKQRDGEAAPFKPFAEGVPASLLGKPSDWTSLFDAVTTAEKADLWKRKGRDLVATNGDDEWTACELGEERYGDCVVRATIASGGPTPVQIRFGPRNQVMLVPNGTFLYRVDQPAASDPAIQMPMPGKRDVVVARRGSRIQVWVDGRKALETEAGTEGPFLPGIGLHRGSATFTDVRVRPLR